MTKKEYDQFTKNLVGKGYQLCNGNHPYYYKTLLKRKDKYDEQRSNSTNSVSFLNLIDENNKITDLWNKLRK